MNLLREICQQYGKWKPLEDYILRIETYQNNDGVFVIDNCKALIESICKTILEDVAEPCSGQKSTQALLSAACNKMACLPQTGNLVRSFHTVSQRLGEFRNDFSSIAHGASVYSIENRKDKVTKAATAFMISTVEQLAVFLITVYQEEYPVTTSSIIRYEDYSDFNAYFDELIDPIEIGEYGPYSPSELLFNIDEDAYRTALASNTMEQR